MYTNGTENQLYPSSIYVLTGIERGVLASHACQDSHEQNDYAMFVTTDGSGVLQIDQTSYRLGERAAGSRSLVSMCASAQPSGIWNTIA